MDSNNQTNRNEYAQPINTSTIIDVSATLKQSVTTLYSIAFSMRSDIWVAKEKVRNSPETCTEYVCNETERKRERWKMPARCNNGPQILAKMTYKNHEVFSIHCFALRMVLLENALCGYPIEIEAHMVYLYSSKKKRM